MKNTVNFFVIGALAFALSSCFWWSSEPELNHPKKISVLWDQSLNNGMIERQAWVTDNPDLMAKIVSQLDTATYEPMSLLLNGGPFRFIIETEDGHTWELGYNESSNGYFPIFLRGDKGHAGTLAYSQAFINVLSEVINQQTNNKPELTANYREQIRTGKAGWHKTILAKQVIQYYPGYPEVRLDGEKWTWIDDKSSMKSE